MKVLLPIYFLLKNLFGGCHQEIKYSGFERDHEHRIVRMASIDTVVKECSGMAFCEGLYWTLGDSGTKPELYGLDSTGKCVQVISSPYLKNKDWEELTVDVTTHRFYIADIGNNTNRRKDLKIYALDTVGKVAVLPVSYALQQDFPPNKKLRNYDCEAMVYAHDSLFLFSKNRGVPIVNWYSLSTHHMEQPLHAGRELFLKGMITGAAYHEASEQLVLLAYGKIYWFKVKQGDILHAQPWLIRKIPFYGQTEAVCFDKQGVLYLTNENGKRWKISSKK